MKMSPFFSEMSGRFFFEMPARFRFASSHCMASAIWRAKNASAYTSELVTRLHFLPSAFQIV